jgi:hypothetical protein
LCMGLWFRKKERPYFYRGKKLNAQCLKQNTSNDSDVIIFTDC